MTLIVVLFLVASTLVIAEVMFPSFGVLGLLAATAFLIAIMKSFEMNRTAGYIAIAVAIGLVPIALWMGVLLLKHSPIGNRLLLKGPDHEEYSGAATNRGLREYLGRTGLAVTPLRPAGVVEIDGERIDAVSDGSFVKTGTAIRLVHVEGNRAVVEKIEDAAPSE